MEGALALALPLQKGQSLKVCENNKKILSWQANTPSGNWFTANYELSSFNIITTDNNELAKKLADILIATRELSHTFLMDNNGFNVITNLDFDPEFGFGSSSTLITNIAMWADVNPYELLEKTFGGSGYDIACAKADNPITYQIKDDDIEVKEVDFNPNFKDKLYFVYLGNKQNSADGIRAFKKTGNFTTSDIRNISSITQQLIKTSDFTLFIELIETHELVMSKILGLPDVKSLYFSDFEGAVKSLGAWGGDFVLMATTKPKEELRSYLFKKGFDTLFRYDELVFNR
jgi:mevalonate kinase